MPTRAHSACPSVGTRKVEQEELVSKSSALLSHVTWSLGESHLAHLQNGDDYTKLTDFIWGSRKDREGKDLCQV